MKPRLLAITAILVWLTACCIPSAAQATPTFSVSPKDSVPLGDHDIGTISTPEKLTVTNTSSAPISLTLAPGGANPGEFPQSSTCLKNLQPQTACEVDIVFRPIAPAVKPAGDKTASSDPASTDKSATNSTWPTERSAILEISDGKNPPQKVTLTGQAFQNIAVSPSSLTLEMPGAGATSAAEPITVTNYTQSMLTSVTATHSDGLTADPSACVNVASGQKCTIYVGFSSSLGQIPASGSVALTGTLTPPADASGPAVPLTRIVGLHRGCAHWYSLCRAHWGTWLLMAVSFCYFLGLVLVRWHLIAKVARGQVLAEIDAVRARVTAEAGHIPQSTDTKRRLAEINALLDVAAFPFKHKRFRDVLWFTGSSSAGASSRTTKDTPAANEGLLSESEYPARSNRFFNALFWTRGQELAGWSLAHEAEIEFVALLPPELVRARLETAEQELRQINTPVTVALADRISQALTSGEAIIVEQARHLLQVVLELIEPVDLPQAARDALLADLRGRASTALQIFSDAIQNPGKATDVNACKIALQATLAAADASLKLAADTTYLLTIATLSPESKALLQRLSDFLTELPKATVAARAVPPVSAAPANPAAVLQDCTNKLASLTDVGRKAGTLAADLKVPAPQAGQSSAWQALLNLCQSQVSVTEAMTHATTPSAGLKLVQQVLENFIDENDAVLKISHCGSDGMADAARDDVEQLAKMGPWKTDLVNDIKAAVARDVAAPVQRWRAILVEALGQINDNLDNNYFEVCAWHNRLIWLVGCALLFIIALGLAFPTNSVLLLVGAVGGLLSRLQRTAKGSPISPQGVTEDSSWGSLFLSPLTGAFSAWGGILLIIVGLKFNLFGSALSLDWQNPNEPVALAIALLFGFSERFFDNIAKKLEGTIEKTPANGSKTATPAQAAKPAISLITPPNVAFGKPATLTVTGANFSSAVKVTITDETGAAKPQSQVKFNSATSIGVTYTPTATKPYVATLTVTNPDNQTATSTLNITAPSP